MYVSYATSEHATSVKSLPRSATTDVQPRGRGARAAAGNPQFEMLRRGI